MGGVFVNYRTGDGDFAATLINRVLTARFGADQVFLASRSIRPGEDFTKKIIERLHDCDVLLAVIGARWHSVTDRQRKRELTAPDDWVHREIAEAFRHGLRVIPVFLDHAVALTEAELPDDIAALARCQFLRLSHRNDARDLSRLVDELSDLVPGLVLSRVFTAAPPPPSRNLEPSAWLRAEYQLVPFAGREGDLKILRDWTDTPKSVSGHLVSGPAGQGKTRLGHQLCQDLAGYGWVTGFLHENAAVADIENLSKIDSPLLVVIDNPEPRSDQVQAVATAFMERPPTAPPARLLLLSGEVGEWLRRLRTHDDDRVRSVFGTLDVQVLAPPPGRRAEFHRAAAAYAGYLDVPVTDLPVPGDLEHQRYATTRAIHAAALLALLDENPGEDLRPDARLYRAARPECPYRGLQPFQEQDAEVFWGRDQQIADLAKVIDRHRMVMVFGPSGCGKSSLIRAGILPPLRRDDVALTVFRPSPDIAPLEQLTQALAPIVGADRLGVSGDLGLLADAVVETVGRLVLFVDQFEELVAVKPEAAREMLELVADLVRAAPLRPAGPPAIRAVFTGRSADLDEVLTTDLAAILHTVPLPRMGQEGLRTAITGPADLPLVSFEPGLVDRIIADAADSPGKLPLVEFALTRLWESQQGGTLTHRGYDEQGGVTGALASYAQEVSTELLLPSEQKLAEQLLVQLARPNDDGGFTLTPARFDQLDPESRELARTLSKHRLVVVRHDPGQPEIVALAHEALVQQWPQLREWLAAAHDFRAWQEQLRIALGQWQLGGRDPSTLLRGNPLTTAEDWLAKQPIGLTAEERDFITASRSHQRRGVRRWRLVTALIGVLALVATTSAALAFSQNSELSGQLRTAAAVALAQESQRRDDSNPLTALQLAEAAWRHGPNRPEAYSALLQQYLKFSSVDEIKSGLWTGALADATTTPDGKTAVTAEEDGKITAWTDLLGRSPQRWFVATVPTVQTILVSPDGRWLAASDNRDGITLWDLVQHRGPLPLRTPTAKADERGKLVSATFSADGGKLITTVLRSGTQPAVEVWDVQQRQPAAPGFNAPAPAETSTALYVAPDGTSAWFAEQQPGGSARTVLRDLATGAEIRSTPADTVTPGGFFLRCQDGRLSILDPTSGAVRFTRTVPACPTGLTDLSGRFAVFDDSSAKDAFGVLGLIDLGTGQAFTLPRPRTVRPRQANDLTKFNTEPVLVLPGPGGPSVFQLSTDALLRFRVPDATDDLAGPAPSTPPGTTALSWDGRLLATLTQDGALQAYDLGSRTRIAFKTSGVKLAANPQLTFSADGMWLTAISTDGDVLVLSTTTFTLARTIKVLPMYSKDVAPPHLSVVPVWADQVLILHGGELGTWNLSTGGAIRNPLQIREGYAQAQEFARDSVALPWQEARVEVLIASIDGVELWDTSSGQLKRSVQPRPGSPTPEIITDAAGTRVAIHYKAANQLTIWAPEQEDVRQRPVPLPGDLSLVAFTADNKLISSSADGGVQVWDLGSGSGIANFRVPGASGGWSLFGDVLTTATRSGPLSIDMTPAKWIDHLCRVNDRDYTAEERALLPGGTDPGPPCGK
ncbi:WD40 repeat [Amycolatopsis xylanica]|uniref:WD40 repeat n=1 Tax=Amycolatopsis xylanica TaxID=589385 RepID=A0A1H3PCE5_9PSEU|nr:TIR domain-containing protein [Amycolatopsis xylanica]SDY98731.1 WD40 repeat [Amycolatopsis xylanica]